MKGLTFKVFKRLLYVVFLPEVTRCIIFRRDFFSGGSVRLIFWQIPVEDFSHPITDLPLHECHL